MLPNETQILVIDDMAAMRMRIINQLKGIGFWKIEQAADGEEAYNFILKMKNEGTPIDLVISDWNMPVMTGIDLLEKLRASESFKSLPFIMVTAEGERPQVLRALKSGVTDYLIKPVDKEILGQKLLALTMPRKAS